MSQEQGSNSYPFHSTGATLSPGQVAGAAEGAGFTGQSATTATAIALAESAGRVGAVGYNTGQFSHQEDLGLWQVGYDPTSGLHTGYDPSKLLTSPQYNAQAAWDISSHGTDWSPWSTYNSGAYKQYLPQAESGVKNPTPSVDSSGILSGLPVHPAIIVGIVLAILLLSKVF